MHEKWVKPDHYNDNWFDHFENFCEGMGVGVFRYHDKILGTIDHDLGTTSPDYPVKVELIWDWIEGDIDYTGELSCVG